MAQEKFIDALAKRIVSENQSLENVCIILPSQRAIQYLYRALAAEKKSAFFAPKIITLDAWVKESIGLPVCSGLPLQFLLYDVYVAYKKKNNAIPDNFDSFFQYADQIINDFEEIDRYLVNHKAIFKNLLDIRELEAWQFDDPSQMSERQQKFLAFWNDLPFLYDGLKIALKKKNCITNAMIFSNLSKDIQKVFVENKSRFFYFAGFNAHSLSELSIIKQLQQLGRAEIWMDIDKWYLNKDIHEAGYFARKTIKHLGKGNLFGIENHLKTDESKEFNLYESSSNTGQVAIASDLLRKIPLEKMSDTLLLLGNEELISPLIRNLPKHIEKANITLGIQIKHTALRTWVSGLFDLILLYQKRGKRFYYKDIKKLLKHPFVTNGLNKNQQKEAASFLAILKKDKVIYVDLKRFLTIKHLPNSLKFVMETIAKTDISNYQQQIETFKKINEYIFETLTEMENELDKTLVVLFNERLNELEQLFDLPLPDFSFETFKKIVNSYLNKGGVSFYGNPLDGLQIMGLLETRLLDFETIIGIGINEDALPPSNSINSFIPMDLRAAFELPTIRDKQALFAHHFYRLLHRSNTCHFIFATNENALNTSQKSRYLQQIQLELCKENENIKLNYYLLDLETTSVVPAKIEVQKTDEVIAKIKTFFFEKRFSATSIASFFNCPLNFYNNYILGFRANEDLKETLEANTIGSIIHEALEYLYNKYLDPTGSKLESKITSEVIERIIKDVPESLAHAYKALTLTHINHENIGQNHIDYKMIESTLTRYLKNEKECIELSHEPIYFVASEEEIQLTRSFETDFGSYVINLTGSLDRVERTGETYAILDFKTGDLSDKKVELLNVESMKQTLFSKKIAKDYSIQLMMYRYLYSLQHPQRITTAALVPLLTSKNDLILSENINEVKDITSQMDTVIQYILNQLLNPKQNIKHNPAAHYCVFCGS